MNCPQCEKENVHTDFNMVEVISENSVQYDHDIDIFKYRCTNGHAFDIIDFVG